MQTPWSDVGRRSAGDVCGRSAGRRDGARPYSRWRPEANQGRGRGSRPTRSGGARRREPPPIAAGGGGARRGGPPPIAAGRWVGSARQKLRLGGLELGVVQHAGRTERLELLE